MTFAPQEKHEYEFQMTSFVDVIFVLLSFFVLGTTFVAVERDFDLGYREGMLGPGPRAEDFPEQVRVELRRAVGGVAIRVGQATLPDNDFGGLKKRLDDINMPTIGVLVLAEDDLSVDQVARAMDAALASPMKKISVSNLARAPAGGGAAPEAIGVKP
jgi:biopolymer transport protein ExbD